MSYFDNIKNYFEQTGETIEERKKNEKIDALLYEEIDRQMNISKDTLKGILPPDYIDVEKISEVLYDGTKNGECDYINEYYQVYVGNEIIYKDCYRLDVKENQKLDSNFKERLGTWTYEYAFHENGELHIVRVEGHINDNYMFIITQDKNSQRDYLISENDGYKVFTSFGYSKPHVNQNLWKYRIRFFNTSDLKEIKINGLKNSNNIYFEYNENSYDASEETTEKMAEEDIHILSNYVDKIKLCEAKIKEYQRDFEQEFCFEK